MLTSKNSQVIGTNHQQKNIDAARNKVADHAVTMAKGLLTDKIIISDEVAFRQSFTAYAAEYIAKDPILKYVNNFLNFNELRECEHRYKEYHRDTDVINYDYIIHTTKQKDAYAYALTLCDALNNPKYLQTLPYFRAKLPFVAFDGSKYILDYDSFFTSDML